MRRPDTCAACGSAIDAGGIAWWYARARNMTCSVCAGERAVGARLEAIPGTIALHDRRRPGSRANIDHLVVASNGIWVVDAKRYTGQIHRRDAGPWFEPDARLIVAGRDRTSLVQDVCQQVHAVREHADAALREFGIGVAGALCFVGTDWRVLQRSFFVKGILVARPRDLPKYLGRLGPLQPDGVRLLANALAAIFRPA